MASMSPSCMWQPLTLSLLPQPIAAGSGIPQIKCYLNGVKIPHVVRLKVGSGRWWDASLLPVMGPALRGWPGQIVVPWSGPCLCCSRGGACTSSWPPCCAAWLCSCSPGIGWLNLP